MKIHRSWWYPECRENVWGSKPPIQGSHMQGLCGSGNPTCTTFSPQKRAAGPIHFCALNSVDSSSAQTGLFSLQGSIWFQAVKRTENCLLECLISTWEGARGSTVSQSSPVITKAHIFQRSLFGVLAFQDNLDSAPGKLVCQNSSTSAQILESRGLNEMVSYPLIHTHSIQVS